MDFLELMVQAEKHQDDQEVEADRKQLEGIKGDNRKSEHDSDMIEDDSLVPIVICALWHS